jgi:hypothetical protein
MSDDKYEKREDESYDEYLGRISQMFAEEASNTDDEYENRLKESYKALYNVYSRMVAAGFTSSEALYYIGVQTAIAGEFDRAEQRALQNDEDEDNNNG